MLLLPYFGVKYFIDKDNIKEDVGNAVVRGPSRLLLVLRCTAALSRDSESLRPGATLECLRLAQTAGPSDKGAPWTGQVRTRAEIDRKACVAVEAHHVRYTA